MDIHIDDAGRMTLVEDTLPQSFLQDAYYAAWVDLQRLRANSARLKDILRRLERQQS